MKESGKTKVVVKVECIRHARACGGTDKRTDHVAENSGATRTSALTVQKGEELTMMTKAAKKLGVDDATTG